MKKILFLSVIVLLSFSACKKAIGPEVGSHKFTYYGETDGEVMVKYLDNKGKYIDTVFRKGKWHKTFDVNIGDKMYIEMLPTVDCKMGYYFAQDGRITHKDIMTFHQAYHGIKGNFLIKDFN